MKVRGATAFFAFPDEPGPAARARLSRLHVELSRIPGIEIRLVGVEGDMAGPGRIRAVQRATASYIDNLGLVRRAGLFIDFGHNIAEYDDAPLHVTGRQWKHLAHFAGNPGIVSMDDWGAATWPTAGTPASSARNAVSRLRDAFEPAGEIFTTYRGEGVKFTPPPGTTILW